MTSWAELFAGLPDARLSPAEKDAGKASLQAFMGAVRGTSAERSTLDMPTHSTHPHLSAAEHTAGREALRRFIAARPVAAGHDWSAFFRSFASPLVAGAVLAFTSGTAVVYGAEGSVPGETLYAVKVNVNEPVLSLLYAGEDAETLWALKVLERRAAEVTALALQSDATDGQWEAMEHMIAAADAQVAALPPARATVIRTNLRQQLFSSLPGQRGERDDSAKTRAIARMQRVAEAGSLAQEPEAFAITQEADTQSAAAMKGTDPLLSLPAVPADVPANDVPPEHARTRAEPDGDRNGRSKQAEGGAAETMMMQIAPGLETPPPGLLRTLKSTQPASDNLLCDPPSEDDAAQSSCSSAAGGAKSSGSGSMRSTSSSSVSPASLRAPSPIPEEVLPAAPAIPSL